MTAVAEAAISAKLKTINFISISFDGWTSTAGRSYIGVICHGITSEWTLETILLDVIAVTNPKQQSTSSELSKMSSKSGRYR